jgi:hypothetical protein
MKEAGISSGHYLPGVALEHDQRDCAGRMCCREQRTRRERAAAHKEDRFTTPEIVEYRADAVGPLLQGRQRARCDRVGRSVARLVEDDQPSERRHRLDPALNGRQLRKDLAIREPVRDEHDIPFTFSRCAIRDPKVTVSRIARLREHCGSLSQGAGPAILRSRCAFPCTPGELSATKRLIRSV